MSPDAHNTNNDIKAKGTTQKVFSLHFPAPQKG